MTTSELKRFLEDIAQPNSADDYLLAYEVQIAGEEHLSPRMNGRPYQRLCVRDVAVDHWDLDFQRDIRAMFIRRCWPGGTTC